MKRIRFVFIALATVILVALALLVHRALQAAEVERSARHLALADRVFDEMERELSAFLDREEERPFEHYRHAFVPESGGEATISPLAAPPEEPFLFGYFQILPDGTVTSPHVPSPGDILFGAEQAPPGVEAWISHVLEAVRLVWRLPAGGSGDLRFMSQVVGSTVDLNQAPSKVPEEVYNDSFLKVLNRGAEARSRRPAKTVRVQSQNVLAPDPDTAELERELQALREQLERSGQPQDLVAARLEPMVSRVPHPGVLVLYRTVQVGGQAYRQGFLIDNTKLVDFLEQRVLIDELGRAMTLEFASPGDPPPQGERVYRHLFAEPFGEVAAVLHLEPLPELSATAWIYTFSLLLTLASTVGLFALYKMVAVVVEFAERRQNFVSAVTHELKTPLTSIRMYGEMLRDGVVADEEKRRGYYGTITAEAERLTRLLQNVLELGRLEKGNRAMSFSVGSVEDVLQDVVAVLGPHAEKLGFRLRLDVEEDLPQVRYDRDALVQVMLNLVDNALKYSKDAAEKEVVLAGRRAADGERVELTVSDHGPGVAREYLGKIFEPFYRGEDEMTRRTKGTGIGLSLVQGLVECMNGTVKGRNLGGGGFEVQISLAVP